MTLRAAPPNKRAALTYAGRGWRVFPLKTRNKVPLTEHGLLDATTDPATIARWWDQWPYANVGIATGAESGIVAIDVDPRHTGDVTLRDLELEHGELPETPRNLTGGGGEHYLFKHPGGRIKSGANVLGLGVDVKADGGYIVAPPSLHPNGRPYEWDAGAHPVEVTPAELPDWLKAQLAERPRCPAPAMDNDRHPITEGGRNAYLTRRAGQLRRQAFSEAVIFAAVMIENEEVCIPPLPEAEVRAIAASITRYEPAEVPHVSSCDGRCENAETLKVIKAIAGNRGLKAGPARTGIRTMFEIHEKAAHGQLNEDGFARIHLGPIAETTGQSEATISAHLKALSRPDIGVFEKFTHRRLNEETAAYQSALYIRPAGLDPGKPHSLAAALKPLAEVQVGRLSPPAKLPPPCPTCGDRGSVRKRELHTTVYCHGCGDCLTVDSAGDPRPIVTPLPDVIVRVKTSEFKKLDFTPHQDMVTQDDVFLDSLPEAGLDALGEQLSGINLDPAGVPEPAVVAGSDEWYTPPDLLELAREVLGRIDLDPASSVIAQATVRAGTYYTKEDNGLVRPWSGRVWLNPPYSAPKPWVKRLIDQYDRGAVEAALILVNNATDATWFQELIARYPVLFPNKRIAFDRAGLGLVKGTRQGQALFYLGPDLDRFIAVFAQKGRIVKAPAWAEEE